MGGPGTSRYRLAASCTGSSVAQWLHRLSRLDLTHPTHVYAELNNDCNSRCIMCDMWRQAENAEIPGADWIAALTTLRSVCRTCKVSFSGGEVFLKKDVWEIFSACDRSGIPFGIVTNGILLTADNVDRYLAFHPSSLSVSLDSLKRGTYERLRGSDALPRVLDNLASLMERVSGARAAPRVTIKTVVSSGNLGELPGLAAYAHELGVSGIVFDPIKRRREPFLNGTVPEFERLFDMDAEHLAHVSSELSDMKRRGYPILNSHDNMRQWLGCGDRSVRATCSVPLTSMYVNRYGQVRLCDYRGPSVGTIRRDAAAAERGSDLRRMWGSRATRALRRQLAACSEPCVYCVRRGFADYLRLFQAYGKTPAARTRLLPGSD